MQRCSTLGHRCTLTIPHPRITFSPISQKTCPVTKFSSALHTPPALLSHITPSARPILRPRACPRGRRAGSGPLTKAQSDSYMASVLGRAAAGHPIEGGRPPHLQRGARSHLLTAGPHTPSRGRALAHLLRPTTHKNKKAASHPGGSLHCTNIIHIYCSS